MPQLTLFTVDAASVGDWHTVARVVAEQQPDIACVHGAPSLLRWRSTCAALAREAGLVVVCGGRTGGGNLLLSSLGVDVEGVAEVSFAGHHGPRPPGAALATLRLRGSAFRFAGVRLHGASADQRRQNDELQTALDALTPDRPPAVIAASGDDAGVVGEGRTALPGGVSVDDGITVGTTEQLPGGVRVELTLPS